MNAPGIEINVLMDAACNNRDIATELMKLFFNLTGQERARLADAVARYDHATASAVAHKVAGSCISCGMSGVSARFKELEHLCKEAMPADINDRLKIIDTELQEARRAMEEYFNCSLAP